MRISKPLKAVYAHMTGAIPLLANRSHWVHTGISCALCEGDKEGNDIVGYRYFCTLCGISLCEYCEQTGGHDPGHTRLKMIPPPETANKSRK